MQPTSCPSCKHTNPPGSNFCNVCGTALPSLQCPHCGSLNDVAVALYCHQCGGSLLAPGRAPEWTAPAALTGAAPAAAMLASGEPPKAAVPMRAGPRDDTIAQLFSHPVAMATPPDRTAVALQTYEPPAMHAEEPMAPPARRRGAPIVIGAAVTVVAVVAAGALYLLKARQTGDAPAARSASAAAATAVRPASQTRIPPAAKALPDATADALARAEALLSDTPPAAGPAASGAAPALIAPAPVLPAAPKAAPLPLPTPTPTPTSNTAARPARIAASPVVDAAISHRNVEPTPTPTQPPPCTDGVAALGLCSR